MPQGPSQVSPVLEKVLQYLRDRAASEPGIESLILFGSRARGDAHERSDFDVAALAPNLSHADWARWALETRERFPSLLGLDLVRIESGRTAFDLQEKIHAEGKAIYVRDDQ